MVAIARKDQHASWEREQWLDERTDKRGWVRRRVVEGAIVSDGSAIRRAIPFFAFGELRLFGDRIVEAFLRPKQSRKSRQPRLIGDDEYRANMSFKRTKEAGQIAFG